MHPEECRTTLSRTVCIATIIITIIIIIRPRRSRSAAAYSRQTFPWTICWSVRIRTYVRTYVRGASVGLSSALWKNGGSDPDAIWHHRSDGFRDEADSEVWESVYGKGHFFWANLGRAIVTNGDFTAYMCDSAATRPSSQITLGSYHYHQRICRRKTHRYQ